jgi:hypothetical protein
VEAVVNPAWVYPEEWASNMNFKNLKGFLEKSAASRNLRIKKQANNLMEAVMAAQEEEQVVAPEIHEESPDAAIKDQGKDQVDQLLLPAFPELAKEDGIDSSFGKSASAYVTDVAIKDLPKDTKETIEKFVPVLNPNAKVVQYGMVVDELRPKVDHHNYESACDHIKKDYAKDGKRTMGDKFQDKVKTKYILMLNDCIIDGHHFLALADKLGITCSLRVLDLTPMRFQEKRGSVLQMIKRSYEQDHNSRKGGISVPRNSRSPFIFRGKGTR